jgi:hypothetical protein
MITSEQLLNLVNNDIQQLEGESDHQTLLLRCSLFDSLYKALTELDVSSKLTRSADDFYDANRLYIGVAGMYIEVLNDQIIEKPELTDDDRQFIAEQSSIFTALLAKLFRTARSITEPGVLESVLPGKLWIDNVKALYIKSNNQ